MAEVPGGKQSDLEMWRVMTNERQQQSRQDAAHSTPPQAISSQPPPRAGSLIDSARNAPRKDTQSQEDAESQVFSQYTQQYQNSNGHYNQQQGYGRQQEPAYYEYDSGGGGSGGKHSKRDWMD